MAKPLSQQEIDLLLEVGSQVSTREEVGDLNAIMPAEEQKRVNPYNFKRPRLFAQDQMRVLNHVHESFARDFSVYLSAQLRTIVDIGLKAVDQVLYSEYVMSSAPPSALYVISAKNMNQKMIFELDPSLVIFTIEKLFGGQGVFLQKSREVSQIEQRIMSKVMTRAYRELERVWQQVHDIELEEVAFESNAEFVQIIPAVEPALVVTFEVTVYDQHSFINICYPYLLLERMLGRAGMKQWISSATSQVPSPVRERYEDTVRKLEVQIRAELGRTRLPISELMRLEQGDVIPLQRRANEPVDIFVGEQSKFKAVPGRSGRYRALRVIETAEPIETFDEDELR